MGCSVATVARSVYAARPMRRRLVTNRHLFLGLVYCASLWGPQLHELVAEGSEEGVNCRVCDHQGSQASFEAVCDPARPCADPHHHHHGERDGHDHGDCLFCQATWHDPVVASRLSLRRFAAKPQKELVAQVQRCAFDSAPCSFDARAPPSL